MIEIQKIQTVLARMAELLRSGGLDDWASALEDFHSEVAHDSSAATVKILSLYGGMGSFNDLVLYKNGVPLIEENNELDTLKAKLYDLCHK